MTAAKAGVGEADRVVDLFGGRVPGAQSSDDHPVELVMLTPGQRVRLQRLLEDELRAALRAAAEAGARPGDLAATMAERRRAVEELLVDEQAAVRLDDLEHPGDQPARGESIGEQGR